MNIIWFTYLLARSFPDAGSSVGSVANSVPESAKNIPDDLLCGVEGSCEDVGVTEAVSRTLPGIIELSCSFA